ncbi:MAG: radical SAM protein [Gammaproteobacteria bacterium]|nr:radical SAM protein [Gammaproteobacteria bacterium]MCP5196102.1 radical SAM protein [Gammaproteobacteria bacterium]
MKTDHPFHSEQTPGVANRVGSIASAANKIFSLFLLKPSHYDDDGYVIQWAKSSIPSNTLAVLYGLALDCADRRVLGHDVEIRITAWDETNTRIQIERIIREIQAGSGLVCLVGVQTNQFPRALDIARSLRSAGVPVCIGGFHVSGCLAMLPVIPPEMREAMELGVTLFAGEAEEHFEHLLQAAYTGRLEPLYNHMDNLPGIEQAPIPFLPANVVSGTSRMRTSFDAGRGCPFLCSFCTIINVQGRKSRTRSADDVERIVRANLAQGVHNFFITDDNLARNQNWEAIFDRLISLREVEGQRIYIVAQVDTMCHKIKGFIEKAARAGVNRVFIGLETINPDSLKQARKGQNQITEYRALLQAWHRHGVLTYAGYILGFPNDTPDSIERDIRIIQRELPIDILEFFILTPLPGSADHKRLYLDGVEMDSDMNHYDLFHVTTRHSRMSDEELLGIYRKAWELYYTPEHVETVLRRAKHWGYDPHNMMWKLLSFYAPPVLEHVHPLEGGIFRRKYRKDRRYGMPLENPLVFHARTTWEIFSKYTRFLLIYLRYRRTLRRVMRDNHSYMDVAMTPVDDVVEFEQLEIFNFTGAARTAAEKAQRRRKAKSLSV